MNIHLARDKAKISINGKRAIYLAGPIRNAPAWHEQVFRFFFEKDYDVTIVSPTRNINTEFESSVLKQPDASIFNRQRAWEDYYMHFVAQNEGVIMFYLPPEKSVKDSEMKDRPDKPYGAMTRGELYFWLQEKRYNPPCKIILGVDRISDREFAEWNIIAYDFAKYGPEIPIIYNSLTDLCAKAYELL